MDILPQTLQRIKDDLNQFLDPHDIEQTCRDVGYAWRQRTLDPVTTIQWFIQQVLHGNIACTAVRHLANQNFSAAAYCQARARLPRAVFDRLLEDTVAMANRYTHTHDGRWLGHRVHHIDGTSFSMPDTPTLQNHYGQPGQQAKGCGFPVAHLLARFDANTGLILDVTTSPMRTHDMAKVADTQGHLQAGDLIIGDCAFCTYAHFTLVLQGHMHGLFPIHQRRIIDFTPGRAYAKPRRGKHEHQKGLPRSRWLKKLGERDQIVQWLKPAGRPKWMTIDEYDALPDAVVLREVQCKVRRCDGKRITVTMATTLIDANKYPPHALAKILQRRWEVETNIGHLKTTLKMNVLHCKTADGVIKELTIYVLVYNMVRLVMLEAAQRQNVPAKRISFADTLAWLRYASPGDLLCVMVVNPDRHGRWEVRAVKRRPKPHKLLTQPRHVMRNALVKQRLAA